MSKPLSCTLTRPPRGRRSPRRVTQQPLQVRDGIEARWRSNSNGISHTEIRLGVPPQPRRKGGLKETSVWRIIGSGKRKGKTTAPRYRLVTISRASSGEHRTVVIDTGRLRTDRPPVAGGDGTDRPSRGYSVPATADSRGLRSCIRLCACRCNASSSSLRDQGRLDGAPRLSKGTKMMRQWVVSFTVVVSDPPNGRGR
jgi:hypothetical protein